MIDLGHEISGRRAARVRLTLRARLITIVGINDRNAQARVKPLHWRLIRSRVIENIPLKRISR